MSAGSRPLAPWYAPATRRLALLRVGLPTLLACVFAIGPVLTASTPGRAVHDAAAVMVHTAQAAISPPDGHGHGDGDGHHG
jgi:hypothetical protein